MSSSGGTERPMGVAVPLHACHTLFHTVASEEYFFHLQYIKNLLGGLKKNSLFIPTSSIIHCGSKDH
eukprot:scaffold381_cov168-Ochromonas_danica.AAC.25